MAADHEDAAGNVLGVYGEGSGHGVGVAGADIRSRPRKLCVIRVSGHGCFNGSPVVPVYDKRGATATPRVPPSGYPLSMEPRRLEIAFVSDVACPWCAIGLASLDQALARLPDEVQATVRVEPFELNPDMAAEGAEVVPYLARKYGRTPEQVAQTQARIRERGAAVGFPFGTRKHVWNTFDAHRMLHWAGLEGRALELKRALLRAYHGEGRNPGAKDVLVELAGAAGLDAARAKAILESDEFASEVRERERHWQERGVSGVPFVLVNGSYAIEGAQPPEAFEQALRQIALSR